MASQVPASRGLPAHSARQNNLSSLSSRHVGEALQACVHYIKWAQDPKQLISTHRVPEASTLHGGPVGRSSEAA